MTIDGGNQLTGITYELPVASAQVKSCILLAGLLAEGETTVVEPLATRDHTERMLRAAGARVVRHPGAVTVRPAEALRLAEIEVPGDISSAAFFIVAATLVPESHLFIRGVGVNPGRAGLLTVLERMGARIGLFNRRTTAAGEPIADIEVRHAELTATEVEPEIVPSLIDELPLIALAAARARGTTMVRGAEDLRKKESDRIATVAEALPPAVPASRRWTTAGASAACRRASAAACRPHGDHRIAMMGGDRRPLLRAGRPRARPGVHRRLLPRLPRHPAGARGGRRGARVDGRHDRRPRRAPASPPSPAAWRERIGYRYLDTGAMYRAVTLCVLLDGADPAEAARLGRLARVRGRPAPAVARVDAACSAVAQQPSVREAMREAQRTFLEIGDAVAEGRDIGEVVWPQAELKVWLDAAPEIRARRRGTTHALERDRRDSVQTKVAQDAVRVDTSRLSIDAVVTELARLVEERSW